MTGFSAYLFFGAFAVYVVSAILYVARITLRRRDASFFTLADRLGDYGFYTAVAGVTLHGAAIVARWISSGQVPMSNMFEYMSFLGWSVMLFFVILSFWYKVPALGAFVAPVGVIVIAYASVFPTSVKPLVPVLQSYWLPLHVSTAALGEGAFAVSFGAAVMYLLRVRKEHAEPWEEKALESFFYVTAMLIGFVILALGFKLGGYSVELTNIAQGKDVIRYTLPPLIGPLGSKAGDAVFLGLQLPLFTAPTWMNGIDAPKKLNTLVLSIIAGTFVYGFLRVLARGSLRELGSRAVAGMNPKLLDEISYRGIAIGFPIFTLGALVFAMIWAQKAWGAYWQWDPKETWALISWLFYSGYLHMRIVRGWEGRPAAWVAALGWVIILFTLVGVNLLISGLHSYAA
ncbi:MAG: c-type cytochrome biogenesis protein CcsB [Bacillota bacterium]